MTLNWGVILAWLELFYRHPDMMMPPIYCLLPLYLANVCHSVIADTVYSHQVSVSVLLQN